MRRAFVLAVLLLAPLTGCAELAGAAIDAGFRKALDHGDHPIYEHKSYGAHFADALAEELEPPPKEEVDVVVIERRHGR